MSEYEDKFKNIVDGLNIDDKPDFAHREKLGREIGSVFNSAKDKILPLQTTSQLLRRTIMKNRITKLAAAAVIMIICLGGISFWPSQNGGQSQWWLGPPAAWGQEIIDFLDNIEALVYREQFVHVSLYGSTHVSGQWSRNYETRDRSRQDTYFEPTDEDTYADNSQDSVLNHIRWNVPDGNDLIRYDVSLEFQCYTINKNDGKAYKHDPVEKLRFYVNLMDKADRILDTKMFNGHECIGFEIDSSIYGEYNPGGKIDRVWFDTETKLPVRIEKHGRPNRSGKTSTFIQDQFEYYAQIPAEMFEPEIPEEFINAHPDEIRAAREKEEKGEMIYAEVSTALKDKIVDALKNVKSAIYQQRFGIFQDSNWLLNDAEIIHLSRYDWRKDWYSGKELQRIKWFAVNKEDWEKTSLDFNDENFTVTETVVNFNNRNYKEIVYGYQTHPDNPMDRIIFLVGIIDRADYILDDTEIEGVKCFGFEISAKKYGTNPNTSKHRLWFDVETNLPVRMEFEWLQDDGPRKMIKDQFEWNPELSEDTFVPEIPEGFVLIENK